MHSIRIIGPGRAGTSLAAALSARGWAFAGFLGRDDDSSCAARGVDVLVIATPDDTIAEVAAAVEPVDTTTVVHLVGLARARCAGAPSAPGRRPSAGASPQRRGRRRSPALGRDVRGGGCASRPRDRRLSRRAGGRGGRRGPRRVPRHRLHGRQPRRRAAGSGRAGGRFGRARPRVVPAIDPRRRRRRRRARDGRRPHGPGPTGGLGDTQPPSGRPAGVRARGLPGRSRARHPPGPGRHARAGPGRYARAGQADTPAPVVPPVPAAV